MKLFTSVPRYHSSQRGERGLSSRECKEEEVMEVRLGEDEEEKDWRKVKEEDERLAKGRDRSRRGETKRKALACLEKEKEREMREAERGASLGMPFRVSRQVAISSKRRPAGHPSQPQPESNEITWIYILWFTSLSSASFYSFSSSRVCYFALSALYARNHRASPSLLLLSPPQSSLTPHSLDSLDRKILHETRKYVRVWKISLQSVKLVKSEAESYVSLFFPTVINWEYRFKFNF